jgi:hypothetical protein
MNYIYNLYSSNITKLTDLIYQLFDYNGNGTLIHFDKIPFDKIQNPNLTILNFTYDTYHIEKTNTQIYYNLDRIFEKINEGLEKGFVIIACNNPNQLSGLIICLYILYKTKLPIKLILSAMRSKNPHLFKDNFIHKQLLERYVLSKV